MGRCHGHGENTEHQYKGCVGYNLFESRTCCGVRVERRPSARVNVTLLLLIVLMGP